MTLTYLSHYGNLNNDMFMLLIILSETV